MQIQNPEPEELKRLLTDAEGFLSQLKIPFTKEAHGYKIKCPKHEEKTPSCSVKMGPDGTLSVKCFGCGFGGNVFHLIAAALQLDIKADFKQVKEKAYELSKQTRELPLLIQEQLQKPISKFSPKHYHLLATYLIEHYSASQDEEAKAYLESRGVGFMARSWGCLPKDKAKLQLLRKQIIHELGMSAWYQSGMAYKGEQVISWPLHRLLIPWINPQGQIQALQRRCLDAIPENTPKYVFPSTRFVPVVKYPFCLNWSSLQNKEQPLAICEGAFDTISFELLHQTKTVGIPGVQNIPQALEEMIKGKTIILALNNDMAGEKGLSLLMKMCHTAKEIKIAKAIHKDFNEDFMEKKQTEHKKR